MTGVGDQLEGEVRVGYIIIVVVIVVVSDAHCSLLVVTIP